MGTNHGSHSGLAFIPFLFALAAGCSGDSNSGGGVCQNLAGTYHATTTTCNSGGDDTLVQNGCSVTVSSGGNSFTGTVSGNRFTSDVVSCTVTISGSSYFADCTQKDTDGGFTACQESGTVTNRPIETSGAGGSVGIGTGGTGVGAGGAGFAGSGFAAGGGGGVVGNNCGPIWSETDEKCNACMNSVCCAELGACKTGTSCDAYLNCVTTKCPLGDPTCLQNICGSQLQAAVTAVTALENCNAQKCQSCPQPQGDAGR